MARYVRKHMLLLRTYSPDHLAWMAGGGPCLNLTRLGLVYVPGGRQAEKLDQVSVKVRWRGPGWQSVSQSRSEKSTGMLRCWENELKAR